MKNAQESGYQYAPFAIAKRIFPVPSWAGQGPRKKKAAADKGSSSKHKKKHILKLVKNYARKEIYCI